MILIALVCLLLERVHHAKERNLTLLHQNQQIQNLYTSTCGYVCLYFLNEMHKNVDYFDLLQVFSIDTNKNEKCIENYFKHLQQKIENYFFYIYV